MRKVWIVTVWAGLLGACAEDLEQCKRVDDICIRDHCTGQIAHSDCAGEYLVVFGMDGSECAVSCADCFGVPGSCLEEQGKAKCVCE